MTDTILDAGADMRRRIKAIFIGSIGNLIEYYDIYAYSAFSLYFAKSFFPEGDEIAQQLNSAVLFAVGFLARPFGGWLFGNLADRKGRRLALTLSVVMMSFGSLMIAACPTYASIGIGAPAILALARIIQGLSLGGEYGSSATYLSEVADQKHRGFYSSFQYVTLIGGQVSAIALLLLLQQVLLTGDELRAWGWRIPFIVGAVLSVVGAVMRRNLHETEQFLKSGAAEKKENSLRTMLRYPKEVLLVLGLTMGGTAAFYTFTTYMQKFMKLSVKLTDLQSTWVTLGSLVFALILQPIYGSISDKVGRKPLLVAFGVMGTICTVPLLSTLHDAKGPWECLLLVSAAWAIVSGYTSINAVVKAELFPAEVRATGVAVPYAIGVSIFGGSAESIALWFKSNGHESYFYYYISGLVFLSLIIYATMRDTKHASRIG